MLIVTFVVQVIVVAIFHYYNLQFQEVFVHNRPVFEFFSYTTMEGNQKIDYFAYAVPCKCEMIVSSVRQESGYNYYFNTFSLFKTTSRIGSCLDSNWSCLNLFF